jgi:hypothetical protein
MWKDIDGFEGLYEANANGSVRRKGKIEELKGFVNKDGYVIICLSKDGKPYKLRRNRIIASTFLSNPNSYPCVNHKDENKTNDSVDNLEWCTFKYNINYGTGIKRSAEQKWKPVARVDLEGNVTVYSSLKLASKENNTDLKQISQSIIRKHNHLGYEWYYADFNIKR